MKAYLKPALFLVETQVEPRRAVVISRTSGMWNATAILTPSTSESIEDVLDHHQHHVICDGESFFKTMWLALKYMRAEVDLDRPCGCTDAPPRHTA